MANLVKPHKRKYKPTSSSSSDEYNAAANSMTIEEFILGKDEWRVGTDSFRPVPFPYGSTGLCSDKTREAFKKCEGDIERILSEYKIGYTDMILHNLWPKDDPDEAMDTLIIETADQSQDKQHWQDGCGEVFKLLLNKGGLNQSQLRVEVTNRAKAFKDVSTCLPNDATLLAAIAAVKETLFNAVEAHLPNQVTSISWHMRGPRGAPEAALKPTAMIYVKKHSFMGFPFAEEKLEEALVLDTNTFPGVRLSLEIARGEIVLSLPVSPINSARKRITDLTKQPKNGASIGLKKGNDKEGAGTLGGWAIFEEKNRTKHNCFLTCYHIVQDGDIPNRVRNDQEGIALDGKAYSNRIEVAYPANCDAAATQKHLEVAVSKSHGAAKVHSETQLKLLKGLKDKSVGFVLKASGHRRKPFDTGDNIEKERRLDWALVESPGTFAKNKAPSSALIGHWPDHAKPKSGIEYFTDPDEHTTEIGDLKAWEWLIKQGRTSFTSGNVNIEPRKIKWSHQEWSSEMEVFGTIDDFAGPGDSGSWVYNADKQVVALLFARSTDQTCGIVTPFKVVMEDIEEHAGGKIYLS